MENFPCSAKLGITDLTEISKSLLMCQNIKIFDLTNEFISELGELIQTQQMAFGSQIDGTKITKTMHFIHIF